MKLQLSNGMFFSKHKIDLDHDKILQEVRDSRHKPKESTHNSRPHYKDPYLNPDHLFYAGSNLYDETYNALEKEVYKIINPIFGEENLTQDEMWGHLISPMDQTTVHNHRDIFNDPPGLSWAYYPHHPKDAGQIVFVTNVNGFDKNIRITPTTGDFLLFSNTLLHFTPRNFSGEERVSVSGNLSITEKYKKYLYTDVDYKDPYWYYNGKC